MGRCKEYRQRLKYQVASAQKKTLENQLCHEMQEQIGLSTAEAELLARRLGDWLLQQPAMRSPNQILVLGAESRESYSRGRASHNGKLIRVTPFSSSDLDLELEFGLGVMQLGRLMRMIEEAYSQDSLLDLKQLTLLCNITPTSVRSRLADLRSLGVWVPLRGLSIKDRQRSGDLRSTHLLRSYFAGDSIVEPRHQLAVSRSDFQAILTRFAALVHDLGEGHCHLTGPEEEEWAELVDTLPSKSLASMLASFSSLGRTTDWPTLQRELETDFRLSPVKTRAINALLDEVSSPMQSQARAPGDVVYWTVASSEPAGKPLDACKLIPVKLPLLTEEDWPSKDNNDLNRLRDIKYAKVVRYTTQAKMAGGYLTYADLSFLMRIHPEAIRRLVDSNPKVVIPMRGSECDMGRGVTHRRRIIELYMQMHTETEIVARTGHSYASIENYVREFAKVWLLQQRGLPPSMIRRITGRSMQLVNTYLQLAEEYDTPEYAFRFQHLQMLVEREEPQLKKGAPKP